VAHAYAPGHAHAPDIHVLQAVVVSMPPCHAHAPRSSWVSTMRPCSQQPCAPTAEPATPVRCCPSRRGANPSSTHAGTHRCEMKLGKATIFSFISPYSHVRTGFKELYLWNYLQKTHLAQNKFKPLVKLVEKLCQTELKKCTKITKKKNNLKKIKNYHPSD
jgi:hypothetical protein